MKVGKSHEKDCVQVCVCVGLYISERENVSTHVCVCEYVCKCACVRVCA